MYLVTVIMGVVSTVLLVYILLLSIHVVLSWVSLDRTLPAVRILAAISNPYLNWFRRFVPLRWGSIDLSAVVAIVTLYFLSNIARTIAIHGKFSVGVVLSALFEQVFGAAAGLFLLLAALSFIRLLAIRFRWGGAELWAFFDTILQPPANALGRMLRPRSFVPYPTTLLVLTLTSAAVGVVGLVLVELSRQLLPMLPI